MEETSTIDDFAVDGGAIEEETSRTVLTQEQPYGNHSGGNLAFGPDGMLYVASPRAATVSCACSPPAAPSTGPPRRDVGPYGSAPERTGAPGMHPAHLCLSYDKH